MTENKFLKKDHNPLPVLGLGLILNPETHSRKKRLGPWVEGPSYFKAIAYASPSLKGPSAT